MKRLVASLYLVCVLGALPCGAMAQNLRDQERVVISGRSQKIGWFLAIDPNCHAMPFGPVTIIDPPSLGHIATREGQEYPSYRSFNPRSRCNTRKVPALQLIYVAAPGTVGEDTFTVEYVGPLGNPFRQRFHVVVR